MKIRPLARNKELFLLFTDYNLLIFRHLRFLTFQLTSICSLNFIHSKKYSIFVISKINKDNMTDTFDLRKVIKYFGADTNEVAKVLYPDRQYPRLALDRVLSGKTNLDTGQLTNLAKFFGVFVQDLFNIDSWKGETRNGMICFTKGIITAEYHNGICTIRNGNNIENIIVPAGTSVTELITILNNKTNGSN